MDDKNFNFIDETNKLEFIINSLLSEMINKVIAMRKQHLAKLNRECVRRYRQRKRDQDINEYKRQVREQKQRYRETGTYQLVTVGYESTVKILEKQGFRNRSLTGLS